MEESSAGDERSTDAVAEVHENEGVWRGLTGVDGGLMAEGEGLDLLYGADGSVKEAAEPWEEGGLFDHGEVG